MNRSNKNLKLAASLAIAVLAASSPALAQRFMPPTLPFTGTIENQWKTQGEYWGTVAGGDRLGAWLVSQGNENYDVYFLQGGLVDIPKQPGGGWDGSASKKFKGSGTVGSLSTPNGYKAKITSNGDARVMEGTTPDGKAFTLNRVVRTSPTLGLKPPADWNAQLWFREGNTGDLANWTKAGSDPQLKYGPYLYMGVLCKTPHATVYVHVEIRSNFCPTCQGQTRGNSGVYLRSMHEMQVLDSFGLTGESNEMGGLYSVKKPIINSILPPLTWQTYDIYYTPTGGTSAIMTAYLNGVLVQDKTPVNGITASGDAGNSLRLQLHGDGSEVVYNNVWAVQNATETSLPWTTVMAATGPTSVSTPSQLKKAMSKTDATHFFETFNLVGKKIDLSTPRILTVQAPR